MYTSRRRSSSLSWSYLGAPFPTDPALDGILRGLREDFFKNVVCSAEQQFTGMLFYSACRCHTSDVYTPRGFSAGLPVCPLQDSFCVPKSVNTRSNISQPLNHPAASLKNKKQKTVKLFCRLIDIQRRQEKKTRPPRSFWAGEGLSQRVVLTRPAPVAFPVALWNGRHFQGLLDIFRVSPILQ